MSASNTSLQSTQPLTGTLAGVKSGNITYTCMDYSEIEPGLLSLTWRFKGPSARLAIPLFEVKMSQDRLYALQDPVSNMPIAWEITLPRRTGDGHVGQGPETYWMSPAGNVFSEDGIPVHRGSIEHDEAGLPTALVVGPEYTSGLIPHTYPLRDCGWSVYNRRDEDQSKVSGKDASRRIYFRTKGELSGTGTLADPWHGSGKAVLALYRKRPKTWDLVV
jgi:hypothetical protein